MFICKVERDAAVVQNTVGATVGPVTRRPKYVWHCHMLIEVYSVNYVACKIIIGIGNSYNLCYVKECNSVIVLSETCSTNVNLNTLCAC